MLWRSHSPAKHLAQTRVAFELPRSLPMDCKYRAFPRTHRTPHARDVEYNIQLKSLRAQFMARASRLPPFSKTQVNCTEQPCHTCGAFRRHHGHTCIFGGWERGRGRKREEEGGRGREGGREGGREREREGGRVAKSNKERQSTTDGEYFVTHMHDE